VTTSLDAVRVSESVRESYLRYLRTLLPVRDPALRRSLHETLADRAGLVKGPILEATPPYAPGASVGDLMEEGVLPRWFNKLDHPEGLPLDRPLYRHQEDAIRKAATGRNLVVATGTGSGKTESFLLPILSALAEEQEAGSLEQPGVRALLLYPMNALANDQLKRLRELLRPTPEITFGRYTGETLADPQKARERFARQHPGIDAPVNELLSREEMQERPPHLLLTNYAMLEYLLLRPQDTTLFDGPPGEHWRFLVMDEAHVYDGAAGIEVAMLLRRLQDRVASERPFQAIATSATVGGDSSGAEVAAFASTLFGLPFEYDEGRPEAQDVVWATRVPVGASEESWGPLPVDAYAALLAAPLDQRLKMLRAHIDIRGSDDLASVLTNEKRIQRIRTTLADGPEALPKIARELFPDHEDAVELTGQLVALGASVRDRMGAPLVPARYHLWARATEGAFSCLSGDGPHVRLARHLVCEDCRSAVFEFGSCKRCAATYLIGSKQRDGEREILVPPREAGTPLSWFVLLGDDEAALDQQAVIDEDEATLESLEGLEDHDERVVCTRCGALGHEDPACRCGAPTRRLLEVQRAVSRLQSCGLCGGRSVAGQIRRLESGVDASVSVLSTALYQELPPDPDPTFAEKPGAGRKLLFFADSRQDAAYFAPYMADTYDQLVRRRVVYEAIRELHDPDDPIRLDDVADRAVKVGTRYGLFGWREGRREKVAQSSAWTHAELLSLGSMTSLEGLGLVSFDLLRPPGLQMPPPLLALGLDDAAAWALVRELLRTARGQGAVTFPDNVAADDEIFEPRVGPIYLRGEGSEAKRKVLSWLPTRGINTRVDYLRRVLDAASRDGDPLELGRGLWRWLGQGPASELLRTTSDPSRGVVTQLDHGLITVRLVSSDQPVYRCTRCQRVAPLSVLGVCPTLRCAGTLEPWSAPSEDADDDHYRAIARTMNAVPLGISEHTAQFRSDEAAKIQQMFLDGDLNALSPRLNRM
jgi:hypothetical protein